MMISMLERIEDVSSENVPVAEAAPATEAAPTPPIENDVLPASAPAVARPAPAAPPVRLPNPAPAVVPAPLMRRGQPGHTRGLVGEMADRDGHVDPAALAAAAVAYALTHVRASSVSLKYLRQHAFGDTKPSLVVLRAFANAIRQDPRLDPMENKRRWWLREDARPSSEPASVVSPTPPNPVSALNAKLNELRVADAENRNRTQGRNRRHRRG